MASEPDVSNNDIVFEKDTEQFLNDLIEAINNDEMTGKKQEIVQYIANIGLKSIQNMEGKEFMTNVASHFGDKTLKEPSGKLYKQIIAHQVIANEQASSNLDEKTTFEEPTSSQEEITELFSDIIIVSKIIDEKNDPKLNEKKDKILEWIASNQERMPQMERKSFMNEISAYCDDTKMKGSLGKLFKDYNSNKSTQPLSEPKESADDAAIEAKEEEKEANDDIIQLFSKLIDEKNDEKLNAKKETIMKWITANQARIPQMDRKTFLNEISTDCDDKKLKGSLGKVWKDYISYISSKPVAEQTEAGATQTQEEKEEEAKDETTQLFAKIIEEQNDAKLNPNKDKIIEWITTNRALIPQMERKSFMKDVSTYCEDTKMKGSLGKVWKEYIKVISLQTEDAEAGSASQAPKEEEESKDEITALFSKLIDEKHDDKLDAKKGKILEWVASNQARIPEMDRKSFMKEASVYCEDTKVKGSLGKLFKDYNSNKPTQPLSEPKESADSPKIDPEPQVQKEEEVKQESASKQSATKPVVEKTETEAEQELKDDPSPERTDAIAYDDDSGSDLQSSDESSDEEDMFGDEQMPTYIHRAIWFRSDDENLERMVDQAVKEVLGQDMFWTDPTFVRYLYDSNKFEENVEAVAGKNFKFFEDFVKKSFRRELLLDAMHEEDEKEQAKQNEDEDEDNEELCSEETMLTKKATTREINFDSTHIFHIRDKFREMAEEEGYHIYEAIYEDEVNKKFKKDNPSKLFVEANTAGYDWAVWKNVGQKSKVAKAVAKHKQKTYGYWDVLNNDKSKSNNKKKGKNPGVPLKHLNIIFELLRDYYRQKIHAQNKKQISHGSRMNLQSDPILDAYCLSEHPRKVEKGIDIYIHKQDDNDDKSHYKLTWWNCKKRTDCNTIAIKNMNLSKYTKEPKPEDIKEKCYMRFGVNDLNLNPASDTSIVWQWYNNDRAIYARFADYKPPKTYKKGLLHKQIEATYQSNIHSNFPWLLFTKFNNAQITHLPPALHSNIGRKIPNHYLMRFTRLSYGGQEKNKQVDYKKQKRAERAKRDSGQLQIERSVLIEQPSVNILLSMEQVAVSHDDGQLFPRNVQRLKDGKNSLKAQYSGSEPFVNNWLDTYQLSTEGQQKYFWSYILSIATKIKHIDIEIENQLVTIPIRHFVPAQKETLFSNMTGEVAQEQQDALLYKGFLVPPVLGEAVTDAIQSDGIATMEQVRESIEATSKTRRLEKYKLKEQGLENYANPDPDFVFVLEADDDQFLEHQAVMFRFAEIVRKYIIERKHLSNDSSLWPYYKNYSHIKDYDTYHTMVNRFNLSLMFNQQSIFQLFEDDSNEEYIGCLAHIFGSGDDDAAKGEPENTEIAIRHRRKYAATLLLQKWNTLRNLNVLRQQLSVIFNYIDEDNDGNESKQQEVMMEEARDFDWSQKITEMNKTLKKNIKKNKDGWQFLSEYGNLKDNHPIEISIKQYPFFKHFFTFLWKNEKEKVDMRESNWFRAFKASWSATPVWWKFKYDLILLELALQYDTDHVQFVEALKGDKSFDFRMQLQDHTNYLEFTHYCAQKANILHRLSYISNVMLDKLLKIQPSLTEIRVPRAQRVEYDPDKESFIFSDYEKKTHEEYVASIKEPKEVDTYNPAFKKKDDCDEKEHEKYREIMNPVVTSILDHLRDTWPMGGMPPWHEAGATLSDANDTGINTEIENKTEEAIQLGVISDTAAVKSDDEGGFKISLTALGGDPDEEEKYGNDTPEPMPSVGNIFSDEDDDDDDDEDEKAEVLERKVKKKEKKKKNTVDPFISRHLEAELVEVINSFDMIKYGEHMAHLLINEIKEFGMDELWLILGVVMEAIPFQMAAGILRDEMESLERGTPQELETLCLQMVDGTNWRVSAALGIAEYFTEIADDDTLRSEEWEKISDNFENIAHEAVHDIESDHLLYLLLTIPLYDTSEPMNIIKLALEQKRLGFLNNDRILTVIDHIWYHGPSIDIGDELNGEDLSFAQLLPILVFTPFKFYITPIGYNYTLSILFLLYLLYVLAYSFSAVGSTPDFMMEMVLWILNVGYILYELSEWCDKGREYFSVSGLMNVWDIMISLVWIILFVLTLFANPNQSEYFDYDSLHALHNDHKLNGFLNKLYTILFGFQIFLLSTRFLTLFQNTEYLGGLLKIVQMMFQEIFKFFSVAMIVIAAFTFGFYFIYGLDIEVDPDDEVPDNFLETILFTFDLFIGGGTNADSDIGALFTVFLTLVGHLILTNLLIALMTTKYEIFQETAQEEVHFMRIETAIDLAHRDRLMPPPLNVIIYPLGIFIHFWLTLGAILSRCCCSWCNCYSRFNRGTYLCLDAFYCGCNKRIYRLNAAKREETAPYKLDDEMVQRQLYKLNFVDLFFEVSGLRFLVNKFIRVFWCESCYCQCCRKGCDKNCCCRAWCRKCRHRKKNPDTTLNAYHKGCYNCVKLRINDELAPNEGDHTTVRGITMKEYITRYEQTRSAKLHLADTILLKHLTVDTLLCNYCYQPYLEEQISHDLMPPFRVLLDMISCVVFLFTAWIPLILLFSLLALYSHCRESCDASIESKDSDTATKYAEFDREYFPHPDKSHIK